VTSRTILSVLYRFAPFMRWLPELRSASTLRADIIAGVTVALVLIPQSMAYAQLAGLPAYYGLYAAFLPPAIAALFGSSRQLATGPVAVVSLLTAAALEPLATSGSGAYVAYAIFLALIVGVFQLSLGLLRLGVLVNFLSHPVVVGFTNAAAIIIATSQLGKIFGVSVEKAPHHYETVWNTLVAAVSHTHFPTLLMAILAFATMIFLRRVNPRIPGVLVAVVVTTLISWTMSFSVSHEIKQNQVSSATVRDLVSDQLKLREEIADFNKQISEAEAQLKETKDKYGSASIRTLGAQHNVNKLKLRLDRRVMLAKAGISKIKTLRLEHVRSGQEDIGKFYYEGDVPERQSTDGKFWQIEKIKDDGSLVMHAGGYVVGSIPEGLPSFKIPSFDLGVLAQLLFSAIPIALIGFMEAISIAKAMAARTRQKLDANQELVGQGISNIIGSFFQSYAVSGSFSRSAVNIGAGAITGISSVVTSVVVVIALLWLTPLLYYLPQATLAAVIMMAVVGLVNIKAIKHAWKVSRTDGAISVATFFLTLAFAPHLENSIMIGVVLSLVVFLYQSMRPRVVILSRHPDGSLRDAEVFGLATCPDICMIRFDGSLYFANTSYFEDMVMLHSAQRPELKYIIVDGQGINGIDATGEEMISELAERMEKAGIIMIFTQLKKQVMDVLWLGGLVERLGQDRFFRRVESALDYAWKQLGNDHEVECPLNIVCSLDKGDKQRPTPPQGIRRLFPFVS